MNTELVAVTAEFIMDRIADWSMPLTFEEHALLMEQLSIRIKMNLNAHIERHDFGACCYWDPVPGEEHIP